VAASGKDTDEPNSPTRKQIQNIAAEPFRHADVRTRTNPNERRASISYSNKKKSNGGSTDLGGDPVHHVSVKHESLLPHKLNRHFLEPLPPPRWKSSARDARRRLRHTASIDPGSTEWYAACPRHPRIVRGWRGSGCVPQDRCTRGATCTTASSALCSGRMTVSVRCCCCCEASRWWCAIAEQAEIKRWFGERVLLRE
jgi:hypothetical protein